MQASSFSKSPATTGSANSPRSDSTAKEGWSGSTPSSGSASTSLKRLQNHAAPQKKKSKPATSSKSSAALKPTGSSTSITSKPPSAPIKKRECAGSGSSIATASPASSATTWAL